MLSLVASWKQPFVKMPSCTSDSDFREDIVARTEALENRMSEVANSLVSLSQAIALINSSLQTLGE